MNCSISKPKCVFNFTFVLILLSSLAFSVSAGYFEDNFTRPNNTSLGDLYWLYEPTGCDVKVSNNQVWYDITIPAWEQEVQCMARFNRNATDYSLGAFSTKPRALQWFSFRALIHDEGKATIQFEGNGGWHFWFDLRGNAFEIHTNNDYSLGVGSGWQTYNVSFNWHNHTLDVNRGGTWYNNIPMRDSNREYITWVAFSLDGYLDFGGFEFPLDANNYLDDIKIYDNCTPEWYCSDCYGGSCLEVTDNQSCGTFEPELSLYDGECCNPDYVCDGYDSCDIDDFADCNSVFDNGGCGENYSGNYSEYSSQVCNYCDSDVQLHNQTECLLNEFTTCYVDNNFGVCCNVTSIPEDCPKATEYECTTENCIEFFGADDIPASLTDTIVKFLIAISMFIGVGVMGYTGVWAYKKVIKK